MIINLETQAGMSETYPTERQASWAQRPLEYGTPFENSSMGNPAWEIIRKIEQTIQFMRAHLNQPLPVSRLAAVASISSSHFFATFKRLTGSAPIEFFINLRMHHACELLGSTSLSVKEIAGVLGYDDQFYFSRVFKLATRIPPTQYRTLDVTAREAIKDNLELKTSAFFSRHTLEQQPMPLAKLSASNQVHHTVSAFA